MAWRHLGVQPEDYPRLPWWKQRLAEEQLVREFASPEVEETGPPLTLESFGMAWA